MTITYVTTHTKTLISPSSGVADKVYGVDYVSSSSHATSITMATARLLGRTTAGTGAIEEISIGSGLTLSAGSLSAGASSTTWDTIGAAAGSATTANGNNTIVYNTAQTSNSQSAFTFGETSAATGGTGSLFPAQILVKIGTLASSTASALQVLSRGNVVFSISPTTRQIILGDSGAGTAGTAAQPILATVSQTGIYISDVTNDWVGLSQQGLEMARFISTDNVNNQLWALNANASTVGFVADFRKSRGTVASPSVITTGDILGQIKGSGYVGGTNKYLEAARIELDSTGAISDATSGIGGIIKFSTTLAGTDTAIQPNLTLQGGSQPIAIFAAITFANLGTPANGAFAYCSDCDAPTLVNSACTSAGAKTGSFAARVNGAWACFT